MSILAWIVLGGLAGWLASIFMRTDEQQGMFGNVIIGIFGALLGGFIVSMFGQDGITGFNLWSMLIAVIGSMTLLAIMRMLSGSRAHQRERIERI